MENAYFYLYHNHEWDESIPWEEEEWQEEEWKEEDVYDQDWAQISGEGRGKGPPPTGYHDEIEGARSNLTIHFTKSDPHSQLRVDSPTARFRISTPEPESNSNHGTSNHYQSAVQAAAVSAGGNGSNLPRGTPTGPSFPNVNPIRASRAHRTIRYGKRSIITTT